MIRAFSTIPTSSAPMVASVPMSSAENARRTALCSTSAPTTPSRRSMGDARSDVVSPREVATRLSAITRAAMDSASASEPWLRPGELEPPAPPRARSPCSSSRNTKQSSTRSRSAMTRVAASRIRSSECACSTM
jgi:hypothetical protein